MIPTVGFNMRKVTKGNVTMKLWDIGGQPRFRSMWERYCRGVNAIVYVMFLSDTAMLSTRNRLVWDFAGDQESLTNFYFALFGNV